MVNYQLGKIYKLECLATGKIYYGATCEPLLSRRLAGHKTSYERYKKGTLKDKTRSFEILENGNYTILLVEHCPCNSKDELSARERFHILNNQCVNKQIPLGNPNNPPLVKSIVVRPKIVYNTKDVNEMIQINQANFHKIEMKKLVR
jgi:hypothetical protein